MGGHQALALALLLTAAAAVALMVKPRPPEVEKNVLFVLICLAGGGLSTVVISLPQV